METGEKQAALQQAYPPPSCPELLQNSAAPSTSQDPEAGGGRIIGEAVHFVDLLRYLAGVPIKRSEIFELESPTRDTASIQLSFADGSLGTIHYFANGNKGFPKERLEVFTAGKIFQLGNFDMLRGYGWKGFKKMRLWRQDKGHAAEVDEFVRAVVEGLPSPIPFDEITEVSKVTLQLSRR